MGLINLMQGFSVVRAGNVFVGGVSSIAKRSSDTSTSGGGFNEGGLCLSG